MICRMPVSADFVRQQFRDKESRDNKVFVSKLIKDAVISQAAFHVTPPNVGRTVSRESSISVVSSNPQSYQPARNAVQVDKKVTTTILPNPKFNPYKQTVLTPKTKLTPNISIQNFMVKTIPNSGDWIKTATTSYAQNLYLHALFMRMVRENEQEFDGLWIEVAEGVMKDKPKTTSPLYNFYTGRTVAYKVLDKSGKVNNKRTFDVAAFYKDVAYFEEMALSYDTIEGEDKLTARIVLTVPEINNTWTADFNRKIKTVFNGKDYASGEFVEVLPKGAEVVGDMKGEGQGGRVSGAVKGLDRRLMNVLEAAAAAANVNIVVTSGFRGSKSNPSGRHTGMAADIAIYSNGKLMNLNPFGSSGSKDTAVVKTFIKEFIKAAKSSGYLPSAGAANNEISKSQYATYVEPWVMTRQGGPLYMSGTAVHVDIARTPGLANISGGAGPYWGGSGETARVPAPNWLKSLF